MKEQRVINPNTLFMLRCIHKIHFKKYTLNVYNMLFYLNYNKVKDIKQIHLLA